MNTNVSWVMYNLNSRSYVRRSQWCKCATSDNTGEMGIIE
jgi:hypothetical protein